MLPRRVRVDKHKHRQNTLLFSVAGDFRSAALGGGQNFTNNQETMRNRKEICLILMILGFISRNPLVTGDRYMSVYDASRRPLCAVAAPSNTTLKLSAIFWKTSDSVACARSCWNSSDCIMFNVYANGSCELFNRCSYGLFQSVNCCQAFSVTP